MSEFNYSIPLQPSYQAGVGSVDDGSAEKLDGVASRLTAKKVVIKNTHATQSLYVGKASNVSATVGGFELVGGESVELEITDPADVWVIGSAAGTTYTWYAL